jgi:hypothetical protein
MFVKIRIGCAVVLAGVLLAPVASAQIPAVPQAGSNQQSTLTKEQIRNILLLRGLQLRGNRRGVQRGVPQFVPFGNPGFMGDPTLPPENAQQAAGDNADPKHAARVERLRQAREAAVAKREEAAKKRAKARVEAQAKAATKPKAKAATKPKAKAQDEKTTRLDRGTPVPKLALSHVPLRPTAVDKPPHATAGILVP